jgi:hypothetical protein
MLRFLSSLSPNRDKELTDSELNVLVKFLQLPQSFEHRMFSRIAKNKIRKEFKEEGWVLSSMNLNNKLYSLEDKGYIVKDEDGVMYLNKEIKYIWSKLKNIKEGPMELNVLIQLHHVPEEETKGNATS